MAPKRKTDAAAKLGLSRPTPAMMAMLANLVAGRPMGCHLRGQSEHGGAQATIMSLTRRGWIAGDHTITELGRRVYAQYGSPGN